MTEDRRNPIRTFNAFLIEDFLKGRRLESVELFPWGKSNTNYKLHLATGEICVLRLHSRPDPHRENAILELVKDLVPVPRLLAEGDDWSIYTFMEGEHLPEAPQCTRAAAEALARILSIEFDAPGWIEPDGSIIPFDFGNGEDFIPAILRRKDVCEWIDSEISDAIHAIYNRHLKQRGYSTDKFCLCHGDYNPTNILIRDGAVSAILDWEFSHSGSQYMDIGNLLRNTNPAWHDQIRAGLEDGGAALPNDWKEQAEFIDLSSLLEFLTTRRSDDFKRQCVNWIRDFVRRYGE